jgi:RHS repeat-associated protein
VTQAANTTENYTYDPVGNRLSSLTAAMMSYNSSNELTATPSTTYTYDANGNTTNKTDSTGTTTYAWDFENRLMSVTLPGTGGTVSFKYDPFGRRIYKSSSAGSSIFAYDGDNQIEQTNSSGTAVARYAQGLNIDEPLAMLSSATTSYYEADGLGSTSSLSSSAGSLAQSYTFDSFGKQTNSSGSLTNPFQYTAREFDTETNLHYYRARYYDQNVGRFVSEDPLGYDSDQNDFYAYVGNSPVGNVDPFGLAHCTFSLNGIGGVGMMVCIPDKPGDPIVWFPANSGNNGDPEHKCQNNSNCPPNAHGPLPLGPYKFGGPSATHANLGGIHLIPTGPNNQYGADGRFLTHWCVKGWDDQQTPGRKGHFCSEGCIVSSPDNIKALNNLLAREPGSTLFVYEW